MAQSILIKRSNSTATPASLLEGELAYSTVSKNLFIGTNGGAGIEILGGQTDHTKLAGIAAGADVSTVFLTANTFTGKQTFSAVSASAASILIPNGSLNPTTPVSGDLWANTGVLKWYNGTATKDIAFLDSNITGNAANVTGTVAATNGGTGQTVYAVGDILYASTTTALSKLPDVVAGNVLLSGGVGIAPAYGKVGLTTHITGTLAVANGGTGVATLTGYVKASGTSAFTASASIPAADISNVAAGNIAATTVQAAINELDTEKLAIAGGTMTGALTLSADPVNALHAATKQYVDGLALGLDFKNSVITATTANITLSGTQTIDGIALIAGDRVLVKNQTTGSQNGIYVVSATAWARAADANISAEVTSGMLVFVEKGTTQATTSWVLNTQGAITLDTTALTFVQFSGSGTYTAGTGIVLTGSVFSLDNHSAALLTSGTLNDARLSTNVMLITTTVDGGVF